MEFSKFKIIQSTPEATSAVDVRIILVTVLIYHVEVTCNKPTTVVGSTDVSKLIKEHHLFLISVWAINCG
jgi:hypothetical protein